MRSREAISENNELKMPFVVAQRSSDAMEGENTNGKRSNNFGADGVRLASGTSTILWVVYNLRLDFKERQQAAQFVGIATKRLNYHQSLVHSLLLCRPAPLHNRVGYYGDGTLYSTSIKGIFFL